MLTKQVQVQFDNGHFLRDTVRSRECEVRSSLRTPLSHHMWPSLVEWVSVFVAIFYFLPASGTWLASLPLFSTSAPSATAHLGARTDACIEWRDCVRLTALVCDTSTHHTTFLVICFHHFRTFGFRFQQCLSYLP